MLPHHHNLVMQIDILMHLVMALPVLQLSTAVKIQSRAGSYLFFRCQQLRGDSPGLVLANELSIMPLWDAVHPGGVLLGLHLLLVQLVVLLLLLHKLCLLPVAAP